MVCFVIDLLRRVVLLLMVGFFVGFRVGILDDKVSIQQNHHIKSCSSVCYEYETLACNLDNFGLPNL